MNLASSCAMPVAEGMKVHTNTRRVREARRLVVELLLSEHDGDCQTCDRREDCELQALSAELGIRQITYHGEKTSQANRRFHARPDARPRQVHQVPPLCERLQRNAARGCPVGARTRLRHGDRPGLQSRLEHGGLRAVRPVRRRLPRRGDHRARPDRRGLGSDRRSGQARGRADRTGDPRRAGRVFSAIRPARWSPAR